MGGEGVALLAARDDISADVMGDVREVGRVDTKVDELRVEGWTRWAVELEVKVVLGRALRGCVTAATAMGFCCCC